MPQKEISELGRLIEDSEKPNVTETVKLTTKTKNIDSNILEFWLNDTLKEAKTLNIPGCLNSSGKHASIDFGIDRITLANSGIPSESIDNLYRCLFTNTVGFYNNIKDIITHQANSFLISNQNPKQQEKLMGNNKEQNK